MKKKIAGCFLALSLLIIQTPSVFAEPEETPQRELSIVAYVDPILLRDDAGQKTEATIRESIIFLSDAFKEFRITFVLKIIRPWESVSADNKLDAEKTLEELGTYYSQEPHDILIGFIHKELFSCETPKKNGDEMETKLKEVLLASPQTKDSPSRCPIPLQEKELVGVAWSLGKAVGIVSIREEDWTKFILFHEVGHIFGADDIKEREAKMPSIMITPLTNTGVFDTQSKEIIKQNRMRTFEH